MTGGGAPRRGRTLVLVTGPPGAGKSTLAGPLAEALGLTRISKDAIKEALFAALGTGDLDWSSRLGAATFEVMFALAEASPRCLLEANFAPSAGPRITAICPRPIEVYCSVPPEEAVRRYRNRAASGRRHPGHLDDAMAPVLERRLASSPPAPLALGGPVLRVDTTSPAEASAIAAWVRARDEWTDGAVAG